MLFIFLAEGQFPEHWRFPHQKKNNINIEVRMSYLKFDKEKLVNLEYSLQREFLRTNRSGYIHPQLLQDAIPVNIMGC